MLRPQIKRRHIENRVFDWDHKQVAANDPRTHLIPQCELLRDFRILIDQRLDLEWTVDELIFGKFIDNKLTVIGWIAASSEPCDHVVAAARHHGEHEEQFGLRLPRQPHDNVVRKDKGCNVAAGLTLKLPKILPVIENVSRFHVIGLIDLRLNPKEIFRIANMLLQVRWHGCEWLEQVWENSLVCSDDWICNIHQIKIDDSIIGINDDLH